MAVGSIEGAAALFGVQVVVVAEMVNSTLSEKLSFSFDFLVVLGPEAFSFLFKEFGGFVFLFFVMVMVVVFFGGIVVVVNLFRATLMLT